MVQPLQFSMIMTLDSKGAQQGAREVRQEIASTGQAAKAAGGDLSAMATGMQAEAAAAKQVTQALTGAAGADLRTIGSLSNLIRNTFFTAPGVETAADLKGGVVGISSAGSEKPPKSLIDIMPS